MGNQKIKSVMYVVLLRKIVNNVNRKGKRGIMMTGDRSSSLSRVASDALKQIRRSGLSHDQLAIAPSLAQ